MKPRIVLSGVNLIEGGALSIFQDALRELQGSWSDDYEIIALVHSRALFGIEGIIYLEFPEIKRSWLRRLWFEYYDCKRISRALGPHLWLAMHDITPNVEAAIRAVYCHNPAPFYRTGLVESWRDRQLTVFILLYHFLYRANLARNNFVIVQQEWLRREFYRRYRPRLVVVSHPSIPFACSPRDDPAGTPPSEIYRFFYPAFPRTFKNFGVLLEAARILEQRKGRVFQVWVTLQGNENSYSERLAESYRTVASIKWLGRISREQVIKLYSEVDCLVFPSRLETWGMPISEFKETGSPMLVADLPYAHETAGNYERVHFFAPDDPGALADDMEKVMNDTLAWAQTEPVNVAPPFASDWGQLFEILLGQRRPIHSKPVSKEGQIRKSSAVRNLILKATLQ